MEYDKGRLNTTVLETKEQNKVTNTSIDINAVHSMDKMDLHRRTGEMLNRDVMVDNLGIKKLQVINFNLKNQHNNEKLANRTSMMRAEELEQ